MAVTLNPIAHIESPYPSKFGVPRQAGLAEGESRIVFEPGYRVAEALRGLDDFEYLWIVWLFHLAERQDWSPTVRPPRLGGNRRLGVFATRSPFRPNNIGLSSVQLMGITHHPILGPVIHIGGADLVDGTPILDIKPYIPYTDAHPDARAGYATQPPQPLDVDDPEGLLGQLPTAQRQAARQALALDPRPHYHSDPQRIYAMPFAGHTIRFSVADGVVRIHQIAPL